jgi:intein-encoded DNA endonuclease-like protein
MTRESFTQKVNEIMKDINKNMLPDRINKILTSGCIDLECAEDNYILPKAFICAFAREIEYQYKTLGCDVAKEANNMSHFM